MGTTWYERIKAMSIDEMTSFFTYLAKRGVIATADRVICQKCKAENGGHCPDVEQCLHDCSDKGTIKKWLESDAYLGA